MDKFRRDLQELIDDNDRLWLEIVGVGKKPTSSHHDGKMQNFDEKMPNCEKKIPTNDKTAFEIDSEASTYFESLSMVETNVPSVDKNVESEAVVKNIITDKLSPKV